MSVRAQLYQGREFDPKDLRHLQGTFRASFESAVRQFAEREFLVLPGRLEGEEIGYDQFHCDVRTVAHGLAHHSASVVVTIAGNSYEHIVYIFATLFLGKTLAPMSANETVSYLQENLSRLNLPHVVFTDRSDCLAIAHPMKIPPHKSGDIASQPPRTEDFIYILTSGSTGRSKFVRQTESGVLSNVEALIRHHQLDGTQTIGTSLPLFHVNALEFSLFASFFSGGRLVLWDRFDVDQLNFLAQVQIYSTIPTLLRILVEVVNPIHLQHLKYFVSAATYLPNELVRRVQHRLGLRVVQGYGLSEAVNFSCLLPIDLDDDQYQELMIGAERPSIGVALWGNTVTVRDTSGRECPSGVIGDIYIQGHNVMSGYLHEQKSSLADEFGLQTGDRGYCRDLQGRRFFFFESRTRDVIKRNGETIGLRDIDDLCANLAGVDGITVAFPNDTRGEEIGLVIKVDSSAAPLWVDELRLRIERLSEARRPKVLFQIREGELRTPSGKPMRWKFVPLFAPFQKTVAFRRFEIREAQTVGEAWQKSE